MLGAAAFVAMSLAFGGCGTNSQNVTVEQNDKTEETQEIDEAEDSSISNKEEGLENQANDSALYVQPIPDISDDFIRGMDASAVLVVENSGSKYYGFDGQEQDVFKTLAEAGVNYIRLRVWNDPYDENGNGYGGGNNDLDTAIALGKRASEYGMKVSIDFHYSDFWADPKRQHCPKAWEGLDVDAKAEKLYEFTNDSLKKLLDEGVDVGMVQIGNEINFGMSGEKSADDVAILLSSGSKAVREIADSYNKDIKVVVHYTDVETPSVIFNNLNNLVKNEVDYDIVGLSYYPYWHGPMADMQKCVKTIRETFGKDVAIVETSYCYTSKDGDGSGNSYDGASGLISGYPASPQGQASMVRDVCAAANEAGAIGVFYWEGTWIPVGTVDGDNSELWEKYGSGWASSFAGDYDPEDAGKYYGGCSWDNQAMFDFTGHPLESLMVWKNLKEGCGEKTSEIKVRNRDAIAYDDIEMYEIAIEEKNEAIEGAENLVLNPSFEDSDTSMWNVKYEGDENPTDFFEKAEDAHSGSMSFHFYSGLNSMNFSIEQEFDGLEDGTYYLTAFSQGGDTNEKSTFKLYAITEGETYEEPFVLTSYADWKNPTIPEINVTGGKLTIGVAIDTNVKSWGTVDDFGLYKIES